MYLVSSCLAGINCRYNGSNSCNKNIEALVKAGNAIPLCPEQLAGLPTPRSSCEIVSPSCGCGRIYDGTFSGKTIEGNGFTAELLMKNGIEVCTEEEIYF